MGPRKPSTQHFCTGSGYPTNPFSANSNASLILLYNCPNFRCFNTKIYDALELAKIQIFVIGIYHTSLLGIWFAWTISVLTLIFVKATREMLFVGRQQNTKERRTQYRTVQRAVVH